MLFFITFVVLSLSKLLLPQLKKGEGVRDMSATSTPVDAVAGWSPSTAAASASTRSR